MSVKWDDSLKVGNIEIDADHKELIGLINDFTTQATSPAGIDPRAIQVVLERLQLYAHDHFAREEYIQAVAKYEGLEENRRQHDALRKTLADYIARFNAGDFGETAKAAVEMAKFLDHWLMHHILEVDLKMRGSLKEQTWR